MTIDSFFIRASRVLSTSNLVLLCTLSGGGGVVAYSEIQSGAEPPRIDANEPRKKKVLVLGTGWAATSFLKDLDASLYDVQVVSPRNYFAFTPLLPSVTCGTVEARSIVEPVRNIIKKDVEDAQKIRLSVIDCFEKAVLPSLSEEEQRSNLHFVVVGGGPTGVEFAAELHDYVQEDLIKLYPTVKKKVKITLIQSGDHILNMFDERISSFAENKFTRDGIEVQTGCRVVSVNDKEITMKVKSTGEICSVPHGLVVWSTGIATIPVIRDFMEQIGQAKRHVLATDEWLRVKGCEDVYAIGDCSTINQRKIMDDITAVFEAVDKNKSGTLTVEEFQDVMDDIVLRYPQVEHYLKRKHLRDFSTLWKDLQGNDCKEIDIEAFKLALSHADSQMKSLPATAQVAAQQGAYLARCFNRMDHAVENPEGPRRFRGSGRHKFLPFRYKHFGQFAPLGGEQAAAELPGDWVSIGHSTQWLWYSVYASKQVSWRTRFLVISDWTRRFIFGRDSSRV
ncbi:external alternative NAD(P)H-ubiquinone oxidoreductase B1, mitochondrial-like isoform X2 [Abrus precatorius]|uniref:NADH:ubiquinone reductase (non-electrogenic) n=1 Tax=Abrus precatorius TaxID=3816 RepID=A0A8B8KS03_ABRPR|nr:external alternative NAD(P)H-ubiquinone oxidoreductase B1, mitochondrial-like isoform X2 [Abrus precatorius]